MATAVIGLLLVVMLAAAVVLTLESRRSARAARETADRVLRDYASFAAWQYARIASRTLEQAFSSATVVHTEAQASTRSAQAADCNCATNAGGTATRFQFVPKTDAWIGQLPLRAADRVAVARHVDAPPAGDEQRSGIRIVILPGRSGAIAWHLDARPSGDPIAHGVIANAGFVEDALRRAAGEPLLPPALVQRADAARLLSVKVYAPDRELLFASNAVAWNPSTASVNVAASGGIETSVSLAPAAAGQLIIGGSAACDPLRNPRARSTSSCRNHSGCRTSPRMSCCLRAANAPRSACVP